MSALLEENDKSTTGDASEGADKSREVRQVAQWHAQSCDLGVAVDISARNLRDGVNAASPASCLSESTFIVG